MIAQALLSLSTLRVQSAPLVQVHADGQHYTAQCFLSIGDLVSAFIERANATGRCGGDLHVLERIGGLTAAGQAFSKEHLHAMVGRCKLEHDPGFDSALVSKFQPDEEKLAFKLNLVSEFAGLYDIFFFLKIN